MNPITNLAPASNYIDDYARSSRRNRITDRRLYRNTNFSIAILLFRAILTDIPGIQLTLHLPLKHRVISKCCGGSGSKVFVTFEKLLARARQLPAKKTESNLISLPPSDTPDCSLA